MSEVKRYSPSESSYGIMRECDEGEWVDGYDYDALAAEAQALREEVAKLRAKLAMAESKICTCPSGDGSLRWPCPKHPAVEQAEAERLDWSSALLDVAVLQEALTSRDSDERMKNMDAGEVIRRAFGKLKEIRAQHERIVGELRAENERLANDRDRANQFANGAALEINAALARVEQQERTIAGMNEAHAKLAGLYEAAQAQHSVPEGYALIPTRETEALIYACKNLAQITSSDGSGHADIAMVVLRMAGVGKDERERLVNEWKAARAWKPSPEQAENDLLRRLYE